MESNRSASRQHRSANSCPGGKIALQFVNVRPEDRNSKKQTQAIVRANAAYYHWRHNRPPRDKTKFKLPGRSTVSGHDKRRPTSNIQPGPNANPPLTYNCAFHRSLINYCIAFNAEVILPALFPGENSLSVGASLIQMSTSNPCVLHMFITGALANLPHGSLGDTPSSRIALDMFRSRAELVRSLSLAIKDPVEACKDINIFTVVALAKGGESQRVKEVPLKMPTQGPLKSLQLLNLMSLSETDPVHLDGLSKLIELKGGLEKIEIPGLAVLISLGGLLVATRNYSAPRFPVVTLSPSRQREFTSQDMGFGTDPDLYNVLSMLNSYTTMIDDFCEGRNIVTASVLIDRRNTTQHALLSLPLREGTSECYRIAALIYSLLVTFPIPYAVAPFRYLVRQLKIALSDWLGDDHMLLWVLTMGGIGATGLGERIWFMKELQDVAARIGVRSWVELRGVIKRGLWHETTNDRDGQDLWLESRIAE